MKEFFSLWGKRDFSGNVLLARGVTHCVDSEMLVWNLLLFSLRHAIEARKLNKNTTLYIVLNKVENYYFLHVKGINFYKHVLQKYFYRISDMYSELIFFFY